MRRKRTLHTTAEQSWLSRRTFLREMGFASLGCVLFLSPWNFPAWNIFKGNGTRLGTITDKHTMKVAQQSTVPDRAIPPIDAAAPAITETATFAMG